MRQRKYVVGSREIAEAQIEKAATAKNAMTPVFLSPRSGTSRSREEAPVVITLNIVLLGLPTTHDPQRFTAARSIALRKAVLHPNELVMVYAGKFGIHTRELDEMADGWNDVKGGSLRCWAMNGA